jgi:hypothetical protein
VLPSYLNALTGKGVHVVTVNDYLARRDSESVGQVCVLWVAPAWFLAGVLSAGRARRVCMCCQFW